MAPEGHDMHTLTCILGRKPRFTGVIVELVVLAVLVVLVVLVVYK